MSDRRIEKMTGRDWLGPIVFLLLGAGGVFAAHHYFFQAFPEASVDLRMTRQEIEHQAVDFLRGRNLSTDEYHVFTTFTYDDTAKTYLERELGTEAANKLMSTTVRIWNWRTRLIKPPGKEELTVHLTPGGELLSFEHVVKEDAPGASLAKEEAQRVAEVFLRTERRVNLTAYHLVEDSVKTRPNRLDYTFTWEENDFKAKDATHRLEIVVIGDQVGTLRDFLKIPDQWKRDYEKLRSRNNLLEIIATVAYVILIVVSIFVIFSGGRVRKIHWKTALAVGVVLGLLMLANVLNDIPEGLQAMPTNLTYNTMLVILLFSAVMSGVGTLIYVVMLAASGEPLYRELLPNRVAFNHIFTFAGLRTKEFFRSTLVGYGMAGMHIGLVVLFYGFTRRFGVWAPMEVNYDNTVSTMFPWIGPLALASFAAFTEEFGFRFFAIPLFMRATTKWFGQNNFARWTAVIIPAFMWGFLHSSYPQQPAWIRGVEVGMIGIVAGWVFLNYGILATLVWHYTVDAVLMGMFLLRSDNLSFRIAGALVGDAVLIPLLISVVFYLESRGFVSDARILNAAPDAPPAPAAVPVLSTEAVRVDEAITEDLTATAKSLPLPAAAATVAPEPPLLAFTFIAPSTMRLLVAGGIAALIAVSMIGSKKENRRIVVQATPQQAETAAIDFLRQKGVPVDTYKRVTRLQDAINSTAADYLVEKSSPEKTAAIYRDQIHPVHWRTRFYRELQKEEYDVLIGIDGKVDRYVHRLDEKAPGAKLVGHQAMALADAALAKSGVKLDDYTMFDHRSDVRENRSDHEIVYESKAKLAGDATHRITVDVVGDEINGPRHWVKIPEDWERAHTQQNIRQIGAGAFVIGIGLLGIVFAAIAIPRVAVYWRLHMTMGAIAAAIRAIMVVNDIPEWADSYDTAIAWSNHATQSALAGLMTAILAFLGLAAVGVVAEVLLRDRFGEVSFWPPAGAKRARALLEGLFAGISAILIIDGVRGVSTMLLDKLPSAVRGAGPVVANYSLAALPGFAIFLAVLMSALWSVAVGGAAAGTFLRVFKSRVLLVVAMLATAAVLASAGSTDAAQFGKTFISLSLMLSTTGLLLSVLRFNVFTYAVMAFAAAASQALPQLQNPGLHAYGVQAGIGVVIVLLAYAVWIKRELAA